MCDRSNRPTRSRTARCSSMIEPYCTGISQPPNSIRRAPSSRWRSVSGVRWTVGSSASVTIRSPPTASPPAGGDAMTAPSIICRRARHERPLGLEGQHRRRLGEGDPANLLELVIVVGEVAAGRLHQEVVDRLVDALARLDEPVLDRVERPGDPDLEPGLLGDLAQGGLLARLTRLGRALRQGPGPAVAFATPAADDEPRSSGLVADDDAAGGRGGGGPQADHGADAARGRRGAAPERPERAHCITTRGRGGRRAGRAVAPAGWSATRRAAGSAARRPGRGARSSGCPAPGTNRPVAGRVGVRGPGWTDARTWPPDGPRTWRRCCAPWAAMVPVQSRGASARASVSRIASAVSGARSATPLGKLDLATPGGDVQVQDVGRVGPQGREVGAERAQVAAGDRPGQGGPIPSARALPRVPSMSGP